MGDLSDSDMDTAEAKSPSNLHSPPVEYPEVIHGHHKCKTSDAKWLMLSNIYGKMHRPNIYDVGGTYIQEAPDFWFTFITEQVCDIFLLHIFATNNTNSSCKVGLSNTSDVTLNRKTNNLYLSNITNIHEFKSVDRKQCYLTTYSFSSLDVEFMKDRSLYITVTFPDYTSQDSEVRPNVTCLQDYSVLLDEPVAADFTVETEDGVQYKVHKAILCAHSDVFKAMLKSDTAESQKNVVHILEASTEDVHSMLEFIYCGTIKDLSSINFSNVLMLADKYNLQALRELCVIGLSRQLNEDNAIETLILSDLYDSETLKHNAMKFIKKHRDVLYSGTFDELVKLKTLCKEVFQFISM